MLLSCSENKTSQAEQLKNETAHAAITTANVLSSEGISLQSFTENPFQNAGCNGLFKAENNAAGGFVFATNLKGAAYIKTENELVELKLVKQTNINEQTLNELYSNGEIEIDLNITQDANSDLRKTDYKGVLVIRKNGRQEAVSIVGKLGC